ncbi:hypothetical protein AAFF_G00342920 [Aldrovandia affinis]|uniref:Uncharacterized protein n=1 Tax=Aldrovandia affinis TaxID=143900 RepID=A0AAD7SKY7_9TELE|nr:hypothetical protein AAFF_G00342920 [Aldrovandia affinis]
MRRAQSYVRNLTLRRTEKNKRIDWKRAAPACLPEPNKDNHSGNVSTNRLRSYILPANRGHSGSGFYQMALIAEPEVPSPLCSVRGLSLSSMLFKH